MSARYDLAPDSSFPRWLLAGVGVLVGAVGLKRRSLGGFVAAAAGGVMVFQAVRPFEKPIRSVSLRRSMTIRRPRPEVYAFWRRLENLPEHMEHLSRVNAIDDRRSHWAFDLPGTDRRLEWMAEIVRDDENDLLAWKSLPGGDVGTAGEVRFEDSPDGEGTVLSVHLDYRPPAGEAGLLASKALNPAFERMVREDVRRVKHVLEAGEIPTTGRQPSGA